MQVLTAISLVLFCLAAAILAVEGNMKLRTRKKILAALSLPLPDGAVLLQEEFITNPLPGHLAASVLGVFVGKKGQRDLIRLTRLALRNHQEDLFAGLLYIDSDLDSIAQLEAELDPFFQPLLVIARCDNAGGGWRNKPPDWVISHSHQWVTGVRQAAYCVMDVAERYCMQRYGRSPSPSLIPVCMAFGGTAPLALAALEAITQRYGDTSTVIGVIALPIHEQLRHRFKQLKPLFEERGMAGWIVIDNLGLNPTLADYGFVTMMVANAAASRQVDQPTQLNNVLTLALGQNPGGVLVFQVATDSLVGMAWPPGDVPCPKRYVVQHQAVVHRLQELYTALVDGRGTWSSDLPVYAAGSSTFDVFGLPFATTDLLAISDDFLDARRQAQRFQRLVANVAARKNGKISSPTLGSPNYETQFGTLLAAIDPARPVCPLVGIRLTQVNPSAGLVDEVIQIPAKRNHQPQLTTFTEKYP